MTKKTAAATMEEETPSQQTPTDTTQSDAQTSDGGEALHVELTPAQQNTELVHHLQRLQAEFDNYRKRTEREAEEHRAAANDRLLKELLPIIDTFELSLHHGKDERGVVRGEDLYQGVLLVHDQLKHLLETQGIAPIDASGQFDPRQHEVLMTAHQEGLARGSIITVLQQGYQRNGKVLRPAKVSVAK